MKHALATIAMLWTATALAWPWQPMQPHGGPRQDEPEHFVPQGFAAPGSSPADAARRAQAMNGGGRVLSVEQTPVGWRVKLLKAGNVRIVVVSN